MYTSHFGLTEPPFSITPDPRYLYMSERHREGLAHLLYGIQQPGGFVQLTGEVGTGKTTLCRCLLEQLPPKVDVALILNPRLTAVEFLATVCDELRITYPPETWSVKGLVDGLYSYLLEAHAQGRRTVLIIDEAQNLRPDVLEQIRLLTNLETATLKLLQIILIGQPELIRILEREKLRQLAQRITARYHLLHFSRRDTPAYIRHRLRVAGGSDTLFTPAAMRCVHRLSGGVPRVINVICDRALLGAYAHDQHRVTAGTVRRASREVRGAVSWNKRGGRLGWTLGLGALAVAAAGTTILVTPNHLSLPRDRGAPAVLSADARPTAVASVSGESQQPVEARPGGPIDGGPTAPRLADLLADASLGRDDNAAFASLYSRWGLEPRKTRTGLGCESGRSQGVECLFNVGSWNKLRRFDLPAILELALPGGERRRVALMALGDNSATLALGGREYTFPLSEVERFWDGPFILLWKVPPLESRLISPGMRGKDVEWLRRKLDEIEGKPSKGARSNLYDQELKQRVLAFQASRSLSPDGLVGAETLAQLTLAAREPGTPSLSRRAP
ncbi:MAG TPA: AAA family ATPase [Candidatus Methylomirabilis sp.]|nr:AAA family ATPase [Candidatus Methylomirabilis sp.]